METYRRETALIEPSVPDWVGVPLVAGHAVTEVIRQVNDRVPRLEVSEV